MSAAPFQMSGSPGASSEDDDEEEDTNYEAAPSLTEEERRATAVKAWSTKSDLRKIFLKASACFGEIDWNNDHEISVDEFSRSWFRGRDPHSDKVKKAMAMLGADATRNTIACESFVYNIMRRYVAIETGAKRGHFEALLTSFMKDAHRENERRVGIESNAALELKVAKLRAFNSRAKERAEQQAVAMDRLVGEKQSIARDLEQSVAREAELAARVAAYDALPPPPPAAVSAEADGESAAPADDDGRSAAAAAAAAASAASTAAALTQLQRRFDALEVSAAQSAKDRDAALREKAALGEVVAELRADIATERSKVAERQDYGPLCLKHVPQLRAALCDVPTDLKSLQNLLDDLSGALRVLVRTRPFIKGNPDEKRIGMRRRKWYRRAKKRMRAAANGELTAEQATQFETARRADMDAGDCVVADSEQCAVRIEANGELVREFKPLSDVVPYGGPLPSHSLSAPAASAEEIWSRVEPLVMSATRERPNNVVIFAYGGTGSGKTFTMGTCEEGDTAEDALSQSQRYKVFFAAARMILDELEAQKEANSRLDFVVELKMADNYLDKMNDLLDPSGPCNRMDQVGVIKCFLFVRFNRFQLTLSALRSPLSALSLSLLSSRSTPTTAGARHRDERQLLRLILRRSTLRLRFILRRVLVRHSASRRGGGCERGKLAEPPQHLHRDHTPRDERVWRTDARSRLSSGSRRPRRGGGTSPSPGANRAANVSGR